MRETLKMEKTIEIDWKGEKKNIKMKRLSFGEMNDVREKAAEIKVLNNQPTVRISHKILMEQSLLKAIVDAPFTVDLVNIQNLENEVGTRLYEEFVEFNQLDEKKKLE